MIVKQPNNWVVFDRETQETISKHPFTNPKAMLIAKEAAIASNNQWKATRMSVKL